MDDHEMFILGVLRRVIKYLQVHPRRKYVKSNKRTRKNARYRNAV